MNIYLKRTSLFGILALIGMLSINGCSQKPSSEEIAAQVKAAIAEEKAKEQTKEQTKATEAEIASPKKPERAKSTPQAIPAQARPAEAIEKPICANCGVVVSIAEIEQEGKGSGLGVVAGGVAGGLVGNQIGQGTGRDLATIAGVVGGAIAGNKIEKVAKKTKVYDVTVRMENGEKRILRHETAPGVVAGDNVKVENGHVIRQ